MVESMNAFIFYGKNDIRQEKRAMPAVGADSILIRVVRAGICGSDMHYYQDGRAGNFIPQAPFVLGHEISGELVEKGKDVSSFEKGDRVVVEPAIPCGYCGPCRRGRYNLCVRMKMLGSASAIPHLDGGFAEYVAVPSRNCYRLPKSLSHQEGALVEPLAVGTHAVTRAGMVSGRSVLITGAGTIGQMVMVVCRAMGAGRVAVTDIDQFSRDFALSNGADAAFDPVGKNFAQDIGEFMGDGFDVIFEASGAPAALRQGIEFAKKGATIVQIGTLPESVPLNMNLVMSKELQMFGSFRYANVFDIDLELLKNRRVQVNNLVTHVFKFEETMKAMDCALAGANVMKVQIGS
jgi:L-idonate 5-dehydrogenase